MQEIMQETTKQEQPEENTNIISQKRIRKASLVIHEAAGFSSSDDDFSPADLQSSSSQKRKKIIVKKQKEAPTPAPAVISLEPTDADDDEITAADFQNMSDFLNEKKKYNRKWTPKEVSSSCVAWFYLLCFCYIYDLYDDDTKRS